MKRWTQIFVIFVLVITQCLTVVAAGVNVENSHFEVEETIGIIQDYSQGYLSIMGEPLTAGGLDAAKIELGDALIYCLLTGLPVTVSDIENGIWARVAYVQPPNGLPQAITVWLHPNHEDAAVFTVTVSGNIQYGYDYCVFLSADNKYRVTLTSDTVIYDPVYGAIDPIDVEPGQQFFVWVDMITASSPALVFPDKVVLICQLDP